MPLLGRMVSTPMHVDIRPGAIAALPGLLADRFISPGGAVLVAVGPGLGEQILAEIRSAMPLAGEFTISAGSVAVAAELQQLLLDRSFDAVVAIGGGRTLDVAKYAATRAAVPLVAVATNLAHDGICSPVASLEHPGGKGSFGVAMPLGVLVDLDYVRAAPPRMVRAGVGDALSNLSAVADWRLADQVRGEPVDGLAAAIAETAGEAVLSLRGDLTEVPALTTLAGALVMSGMAMAVAGSSRPCSGSGHEIIHAIEAMFPGTANHGELAGVGALFATHLRGDEERFVRIAGCLRHFGLPRTPAELHLNEEMFTAAVVKAPDTRPGRYTILEHLDLDPDEIHREVAAYVQKLSCPHR